MALKADRVIIETDISLTCESVAERGVTLCYGTVGGSGVGVGDHAGQADLYAAPSGKKVAGLLMCDVVNVDLTRYKLNEHKDEVQLGNRVWLLRKGTVVTNKVTGTPTAGATAYLTANGVLTPTVSATGGTAATPKVGEFAGGLDESGYARVNINLPAI